MRVALLGGSGLIGETYKRLLEDHPFFKLVYLPTREQLPEWERAEECDLIFSALPSAVAERYEPLYAKEGRPLFSLAACHRLKREVPLVIPEINGKQIGSAPLIVKPNCTVQSALLPLYPLHQRFRLKEVVVTHLQAVSGAGRGFQLSENLIPYIEGEEEKNEREPLKILEDPTVRISSHCVRVPTAHGHLALISASFHASPTLEEVRESWEAFAPLSLPSSPRKLFTYFEEKQRPQPLLDTEIEGGMGIALGRLRHCNTLQIRFVSLSHNLIRGGAGGALLTAEYWRVHVKTPAPL